MFETQFTVTTESQKVPGRRLFLRNTDPRHEAKTWWTDIDAEAVLILDRDAATVRLQGLRHNNPQIISMRRARKILAEQRKKEA